MDVSGHDVMGSSGIEGVGTMFPDFSPIKDDEMGGGVTQNAVQEQAMETGGMMLVQLIFMDCGSSAVFRAQTYTCHVRPRPDLVPVPGRCALALKDKVPRTIFSLYASMNLVQTSARARVRCLNTTFGESACTRVPCSSCCTGTTKMLHSGTKSGHGLRNHFSNVVN